MYICDIYCYKLCMKTFPSPNNFQISMQLLRFIIFHLSTVTPYIQ